MAKGKREERVIARNVHYLSEREEKEEERLTFRRIERKARREIFRARRYNYDVARYILLLISRVSCELFGIFVFYRRANPKNYTSGLEIVFPLFYSFYIHKLIIFLLDIKFYNKIITITKNQWKYIKNTLKYIKEEEKLFFFTTLLMYIVYWTKWSTLSWIYSITFFIKLGPDVNHIIYILAKNMSFSD